MLSTVWLIIQVFENYIYIFITALICCLVCGYLWTVCLFILFCFAIVYDWINILVGVNVCIYMWIWCLMCNIVDLLNIIDRWLKLVPEICLYLCLCLRMVCVWFVWKITFVFSIVFVFVFNTLVIQLI